MQRLNPLRLFRRNNPEAMVREGRDLLENGSYAQATVAFQQALKLDAHNVAALRGLGKVFYKKGGRTNLDAALKHYQEAIRLAPMDHDLYAITAKIYDALGKRKEATLERKKFVIVRALEGDPSNPIANNNMGILFLQQGNTDAALDYFKRAIQADKTYDVAYRNLAAAYYQMAKEARDEEARADLNSRAREQIEKALSITRAVPSLMAYARILLRDGELEPVVSICGEIDAMDPANKDVYYLKKLALEGLGRFEEAQDAENSYRMFRQAEFAPPEGG